MEKFKQIQQNFIYKNILRFFGNVAQNYNNDVDETDFFGPLADPFEHEKAVELIKATYSPSEIQKMTESRYRSCRLNLSDSLNEILASLWNHKSARLKCRVLIAHMVDFLIRNCPAAEAEAIESRFASLQRLLKLSDLESEILLLTYLYATTGLCWPRRIQNRNKPLYYAMALDRSLDAVMKVLTPSGKLRKFNLLDDDWDYNGSTLSGYLDGSEANVIERRFYRQSEMKDVLPWNYYGKLATDHGETIKRMLGSCNGKLNILLYGAPGTGKTSFAFSLAKETGLQAFEIRQGEENGKNMNASARFVGIQICNDQEDPRTSLVVIDEADELLRGHLSRHSTEKGIINSFLDDAKIPTIWISNISADEMDESVRRRFDYSICFERLNMTQRISIWQNIVSKYGLGDLVPAERIESYAMQYATSAGGISTVLANVSRMKPAASEVDELIAKLMKPHCELMGIVNGDKFLPAKDYSLEGLNIKGKVKPDKIVTVVRNYFNADFNAKSVDKPRMNILMYGAPGTGKTEFVKHLGKVLDRKVITVKGSDILSCWVGITEQSIARSFRRAEAEQAILFFDEIDGLVQSRERASQSWEVTQVNELLQQMENFDGVMIAATNFSKNLDPAIMRRFTFKLEFDYLDDDGKRLFFERTFKTTLTEDEFAELKAISNLAPGDFRTVRQEQFYLADEQTNMDRIAALKDECAYKKDSSAKPKIGFAA